MPESAQDPAEWPTRRCRTSRPWAGRLSRPCAAPSSGPRASARSRRSPRKAVTVTLHLTDACGRPLLDDVLAAISEQRAAARKRRRELAGTICLVVLDFDV